MKKNISLLPLYALAASAAIACTAQFEPAMDPVRTVNFNAFLENDTKTAVSVDGKSVSVSWNNTSTDLINIYENGVLGTNPSITITDNGHKAKFSATFTGTKSPYAYTAIIASDVIDGMPSVPAIQYPEAMSFDPDADVLVGRNTQSFSSRPAEATLYFARAVALSRLSFTGLNVSDESVQSITITADNDIAGRLTKVDYNGVVDYDRSNGSNTIRLEYKDAEGYNTITGGQFSAYFTSYPGATGNFTVCVTTTNHVLTKEIPAAKFSGFSLDTFSSLNVDMKNVEAKDRPKDKYYEKVTTNLSDWSGEYLLAYQKSSTSANIYNGGVSKSNHHDDAAVDNGKIYSDEVIDAYAVEFVKVTGGYNVMVGEKYLKYDEKTADTKISLETTGDKYSTVQINGGKAQLFCSDPQSLFYWDVEKGYFRFTGYYTASTLNNAASDGNVQLSFYRYSGDKIPQTLKFTASAYDALLENGTFKAALDGTSEYHTTLVWTSSDTDIATVDGNGLVTLNKKGGPVTITVTAPSDETYSPASASYQLTVGSNASTYVKVSETDSDMSGTYLLVYEKSSTSASVFNGTSGTSNYTSGIIITDEAIESNSTTDALAVKFEKVDGGYKVKVGSQYLRYDSNVSNTKIAFSADGDMYTTVQINGDKAQLFCSDPQSLFYWDVEKGYFRFTGYYSAGTLDSAASDGNVSLSFYKLGGSVRPTPGEDGNYGTFSLENSSLKAYMDSFLASPALGTYLASSYSQKDIPGPVKLYLTKTTSGTLTVYSDEARTKSVKTAPVSSSICNIYNLQTGRTYWFSTGGESGYFKTTGRRRMMKISDERGVHNANNVRDLGGIRTGTTNKVIKQGLIYRGSSMDNITAASDASDMLKNEMNVALDVDLRGERANNIGITSYLQALGDMPTNITNNENVLNQRLGKIFKEMLPVLQAGNSVYFHCIYGRDRTAWLALVLEAALGVSKTDCWSDFELTQMAGSDFSISNYFNTDTQYVENFTHGYITENIGLSNVVDNNNDGKKTTDDLYQGTSFQDKARNILLVQGVSKAEIESFTNIMLETNEIQYTAW